MDKEILKADDKATESSAQRSGYLSKEGAVTVSDWTMGSIKNEYEKARELKKEKVVITEDLKTN